MAILVAIAISIAIAIAISVSIVAVIAQAITAVTVLDAGEYFYSPVRPAERVEADRLALLKGLVNLLAQMGPLPVWVEIDVSEYVVEGCHSSDVVICPILVVSDEVVSSANRRDGLVSETLVDWVDTRSTVVRDSSDLVLPARAEISFLDEKEEEILAQLGRETELLSNILNLFIGGEATSEEEGPLYLLSDEGLTLVAEEEIPFLLSDEGLDGSCWDLLTLVDEEGYAPTFIN